MLTGACPSACQHLELPACPQPGTVSDAPQRAVCCGAELGPVKISGRIPWLEQDQSLLHSRDLGACCSLWWLGVLGSLAVRWRITTPFCLPYLVRRLETLLTAEKQFKISKVFPPHTFSLCVRSRKISHFKPQCIPHPDTNVLTFPKHQRFKNEPFRAIFFSDQESGKFRRTEASKGGAGSLFIPLPNSSPKSPKGTQATQEQRAEVEIPRDPALVQI